jgi:hypothetical protein
MLDGFQEFAQNRHEKVIGLLLRSIHGFQFHQMRGAPAVKVHNPLPACLSVWGESEPAGDKACPRYPQPSTGEMAAIGTGTIV